MLEKKELNSIPRKFPSEQQLYDLNTKGRFCIFPDVPVDAADKVIASHTSISSQGGMFGQSLNRANNIAKIAPELEETDDETERVFREFDTHEDLLAFKAASEAGSSSSSTSAGSNPNTLFGSKSENKGWEWGNGGEPSQALIDRYAEQKPTRGVTTLPFEGFSFK